MQAEPRIEHASGNALVADAPATTPIASSQLYLLAA